jgi:hypothetical protein
MTRKTVTHIRVDTRFAKAAGQLAKRLKMTTPALTRLMVARWPVLKDEILVAWEQTHGADS